MDKETGTEKNPDSSMAKPSNCPEITIKEFLDFLKTAYQVQDTLENLLLANGMTEAVDWLKLKENELVKPKESETDSKSKTEERRDLMRRKSDSSTDSNDTIKRKLSEVLSEGLLDSVLPYLVPSSSQQASRRSSMVKVPSEKTSQAAVSATSVTKKKSGEIAKSAVLKTE